LDGFKLYYKMLEGDDMAFPNFQHHPDGFIFVRTEAGVYQDTISNFQIDFGSSYPAIPNGYIGRYYEPGVSHYLTTGNISAPQSLPWPEGDRYIAAYQQLVANQNIRWQLK
jgi:hypothetical protein